MSTLYSVATPIGNLEDITLRALRVLKDVDIVFAEDTRVTKKLLAHYEIETPVLRLDAQTEERKAAAVLKLLEEGKQVALVSDAGTPTISDPGARLVSAVHEAGFQVVTVPGPSAVTAALSVAGVPADNFVFLAFPPHKKGRQTFFETLAHERRTVVFYESPHRIVKTLTSLAETLSDTRQVVICRELTKIHEEVVRGNAQEVHSYFEAYKEKQKGEFVVILDAA